VEQTERYRKLREQETREFVLPESVADLMVMGSIPGGLVEKALTRWGAWKTELAQAAPIGAQERFTILTYALAQAVSSRPGGSALRGRLVREAREVVTAPFLRDQLLALEARDRIRDGDLRAAEALLSNAEAESDNLGADSDVRTSRALLALARGRANEALEQLGREAGDIPTARPSQPLTDLLRLAAYDAAGNADRADRELQRSLRLYGRLFFEAVRERYPDLVLWTSAWRRAEETRAAAPPPEDAPSVAAPSKTTFGRFTLLPMWIGIALLAVVPLFGDDIDLEGPGWPSIFFWFGLYSLGLSAILWVIDVWVSRNVILPTNTVRSGLPGVARILGIRQTGIELFGVPQLRMDLEVFLGDDPPFRATSNVGVLELNFPAVQALRELAVLVDPHNRETVEVVLPGGG